MLIGLNDDDIGHCFAQEKTGQKEEKQTLFHVGILLNPMGGLAQSLAS